MRVALDHWHPVVHHLIFELGLGKNIIGDEGPRDEVGGGVEGKGVGVVAAWRRALCAVLEAVFVGGAVHVERVRCCV